MVKVGEVLSVSTSSCSSLYDSEAEELQKMPLEPPKVKPKKCLSKQLSMLETKRDTAWERRRRQMLNHLQRKQINEEGGDIDLTDEDLSELKGSIELGFGFNEEQGQQLTTTLPALDLYFAVTRQISPLEEHELQNTHWIRLYLDLEHSTCSRGMSESQLSDFHIL
ncbi:hypothetical protein Rs2_00627 [Raphanus sativus]|nr:hypothetical protein Rs2_00627 [Raphanus sativus]